MRFTKPRLQVRIATILVTAAVAIPALRAADLVPTKYMVAAADLVSDERASSLKFRFDHEEELLGRASQRIWFGWGRSGRSRIFDEWGNDISVSDGRWIVTLGQFGLFGFLAEFGLLAVVVIRAASALKFTVSKNDSIFLEALALIIAITAIHLLPDSPITPLTWLFAGALLGRAETLERPARHFRQNSLLVAADQSADNALQVDGIRAQQRTPTP